MNYSPQLVSPHILGHDQRIVANRCCAGGWLHVGDETSHVEDRREGSRAATSLITPQSKRMHLPEQQCLLSLYNAASNEIARLVYERFAGCFDGNNCKRGYGRALTMIASITSAIFDDVAESKLQPLNCPSILHSPPQYNRIICSRFSCVPSEPTKSDLCHICPLSIPSRCATSCHFPSFVSSAEREDHPFSGFKCLY